jgi:hypothetical protein
VLDVQKMPTGELLQDYRETLLALGRRGGQDPALTRRADLLEEEVSRRMAW